MRKSEGNTQINFLSHASIYVEGREFKLLIDPWLIGSCYWRSWWNYPPVRKETYANIKPDAVYITHFHWDHWHGVSLKKLIDKSTPIITHQEPNERSIRDLRDIGFKNIITLHHAETIQLGDLQLTAYQFGLFLNDSAIVIKNRDVNILNANDCKIAGTSLRQILNEHGRFDFALRSHSSANDRLCYKIKGDPDFAYDDPEHYHRSFKLFMDAVQPKFAIPFASNHCYLHKDVYHLNNTINDPFLLKHKLDQKGGLRNSELKIMLTGDSWSSKEGFLTKNNEKFFSEKETYIEKYLISKSEILSKYYDKEAKVRISKKVIQKFEAQIRAVPRLFRKRLKGWTYDLILYSDQEELQYEVSPFNGTMESRCHSRVSKTFTSEVRMPKNIFVDAVALNMFHHSSISKRNSYIFSNLEELKKYEYFQRHLEKVELEVYPLRVSYCLKFIAAYVRRWREIIVYFKAYMLKRKGAPIYEVEEEILKDLKPEASDSESRYTSFLRWVFGLGCMVLIILALLPPALLPPAYLAAVEPHFSWWDKALHAAVFAVLCLIGSWAYPYRSYSLILGLIVLGGANEIAQFATGWRHMDFGDFVANAAGIMIGRIAFHILRKK